MLGGIAAVAPVAAPPPDVALSLDGDGVAYGDCVCGGTGDSGVTGRVLCGCDDAGDAVGSGIVGCGCIEADADGEADSEIADCSGCAVREDGAGCARCASVVDAADWADAVDDAAYDSCVACGPEDCDVASTNPVPPFCDTASDEYTVPVPPAYPAEVPPAPPVGPVVAPLAAPAVYPPVAPAAAPAAYPTAVSVVAPAVIPAVPCAYPEVSTPG